MTWRSALELYDAAQRCGMRFQLVGPQKLRADGPAELLRDLDADLDEHAAGLVAIVEEFSVDTAPVMAAEAVLHGLRAPQSPCATLNALQARKGGKT